MRHIINIILEWLEVLITVGIAVGFLAAINS
jgi:hypothetical protein